MAEFHFSASGYADSSHNVPISVKWEDGRLTGHELARRIMAGAVRDPEFHVSEANMTFSGSELISNAYACKRLIAHLFHDVRFHDEKMPPFPSHPPGTVA